MRLRFGEWRPDVSALDGTHAAEAKNVIPVSGEYAQFSALTETTDAVASRIQGAFSATDEDGTSLHYVGTGTHLYSLNGAAWTDRSGATYTTATDGYWKFAQYGDRLIATNYADVPQTILVGGVAFADLDNSAPVAPKARHVGVVRDFVMLGNLNISGTEYPFRVQWSAIADPLTWPTPASAAAIAAQSGKEDLPAEYGPVQHITSGDQFNLVFQQRGITRFDYVGGEGVFTVSTYERNRGLYCPNAAVQIGSQVYFLGYDDFYVTDGAQTQALGYGKVAKTFFADFNQFYTDRVTVSYDPQNKVIFWSYPSGDSSDGTPDKVIMFNYAEGRWSYAVQSVELLFAARSQGYTLEQLDAVSASLDALPASLDSTIWMGGNPVIYGVSTLHKLGTFTGSALEATIDTAETGGEERAVVTGIRPLVTGSGTVTVKVGTRDLLSGSVTYTSAVSPHARSGVAPFRQEGRYHRARVIVTGGFTKAIGVDVEAVAQGRV